MYELAQYRDRLSLLMTDAVASYIHHYASGNNHTSNAKRYDLGYWLKHCEAEELHCLRQWSVSATEEFVEHRLAIGEAVTTVERRLATVKHFARKLSERFPEFINPTLEVRAPSLQEERPRHLSDEVVANLRRAATDLVLESPGHFPTYRARFILELMLATGMRLDECRRVVMGQISKDLSWFKQVRGKGKKFRNVYIREELREYLEAYLMQRDAYLKKSYVHLNTSVAEMPLLVSNHSAVPGHPKSYGCSDKTIYRSIVGIAEVAEKEYPLDGNIHPHLLRHTFATDLLNSSKDVRLVAQALGHSDVKITMRYTTRTDTDLAAAIERKGT